MTVTGGSGDATAQQARRSVADVLAHCVVELGIARVFSLMGHGNMQFLLACQHAGVDVVGVRHEGAAVAAAEGHNWISGRVGLCSVTHGPGLTHTATSLVVARRNRSALVLLVAETARSYRGSQNLDQEAFVKGCEAPYRRMGWTENPSAVFTEAVTAARDLSRPVVLAVPADLLSSAAETQPVMHYLPAADGSLLAMRGRQPTDDENDEAASIIAEALEWSKRPVLLVGRGGSDITTAKAVMSLADRFGAGLATTVPAKGLFDGHPHNLGISGGLSSPTAMAILNDADLLIAVGARLSQGTTHAKQLYRDAQILQVTYEPAAVDLGSSVRHLFADASATAGRVLAATADQITTTKPWFGPVSAPEECWLADLVDFDPPLDPGTADPRRILTVISDAMPEDAILVVSDGYCSMFSAAFLRVPSKGRFFAAQGFSSVGQTLPSAVGAALAANGRKVVALEGDAAFMMHLGEVDTAVRHGADLTLLVLNDQALGPEYHRLRASGADPSPAIMATPDLAAVAVALGARSAIINGQADPSEIVRDALKPGLTVVDTRISRSITWRNSRGASSAS